MQIYICILIFNPYEIVRIASVKTMYVRPMIAMQGEWKKKVAPGGFCGHVVNQGDQKWSIVSDPTCRCDYH